MFSLLDVAAARILVAAAGTVRRRHLQQFVPDVSACPGFDDRPDEVIMRGLFLAFGIFAVWVIARG